MRFLHWIAWALGLGIAPLGCSPDEERASDPSTGGTMATGGAAQGGGVSAGGNRMAGGFSTRSTGGATGWGGTSGAIADLGGEPSTGGTATGGEQTGGAESGGAAGETGCDVAGWHIEQANSSIDYAIPVGTPPVPSGGYLIVARNASQLEFEAFWLVALASNVSFINSGGVFPSINGSETYTLRNGTAIVDGATIAMSSAGGRSIQRLSPLGAASDGSSWSVQSAGTTTSSPGTSNLAREVTAAVVISEFSDAIGTGNYIYEFVELYCAM